METQKETQQLDKNGRVSSEYYQNITNANISVSYGKAFSGKDLADKEANNYKKLTEISVSPSMQTITTQEFDKEGNLKKQYNSQDNGSLLSKYINNKRKETSVFIDTDAATGFRKITNKRTGETREDTLNKIAYLREKSALKENLTERLENQRIIIV